jgi:hypothetical protein
MSAMNDKKSKSELKQHIISYLAQKLKKNDMVSYSVVHDFYRCFINAELNSNYILLQSQQNFV